MDSNGFGGIGLGWIGSLNNQMGIDKKSGSIVITSIYQPNSSIGVTCSARDGMLGLWWTVPRITGMNGHTHITGLGLGLGLGMDCHASLRSWVGAIYRK